MTIEVRQMVIRSSVDLDRRPAGSADPQAQRALLERMKAEILAECREWLGERLKEERER